MATIQLLGPQRFRPTVVEAVRAVGASPPFAVITAGWQEREDEVEELDLHLGARTINLELYRRCEAVFLHDRELFLAHRARQDRLRELQDLYRIRLGNAKAAARQLLERGGDPELLGQEIEAAFSALRAVDAHHAVRIREIRSEFDARWDPRSRDEVARRREEIESLLRGAGALLIAGGHVAVLLNRLRLFDVAGLVREMPVVAWSAGAMALADRVVLFHDSPRRGPATRRFSTWGSRCAPESSPSLTRAAGCCWTNRVVSPSSRAASSRRPAFR